MTAPDKIETLWLQFGPMGDVESVSDEPMVAHVAWVKLYDHQAAVAAAYEAAAQVAASHAVIAARMNQDQANSLLRSSEAGIRALATPDQIAALAAERAKLDKAVEALRFYANGENWMINGPLDGNSGNYTGGPAKAVLAEIGGA